MKKLIDMLGDDIVLAALLICSAFGKISWIWFWAYLIIVNLKYAFYKEDKNEKF